MFKYACRKNYVIISKCFPQRKSGELGRGKLGPWHLLDLHSQEGDQKSGAQFSTEREAVSWTQKIGLGAQFAEALFA